MVTLVACKQEEPTQHTIEYRVSHQPRPQAIITPRTENITHVHTLFEQEKRPTPKP